MTAQFSDYLEFNDLKWHLVTNTLGQPLLDISSLNIALSENRSSALLHGYCCIYSLFYDKQLILKNLLAELKNPDGAIINGIKPVLTSGLDREIATYGFYDLNIFSNFTGGILIGTEFISSLYIHLGFQSIYKYKKILELSFEKGTLLKTLD
jgi:hypothetical protein